MFLNAFTDMVSEVRLSTTKILREILEAVGSDYILQSILPKLANIYDNSIIYQERVNVFHAVTVRNIFTPCCFFSGIFLYFKCEKQQLACEKTSNELIGEMIALTVRGSRDKIPNVRFTVSSTLEVLCKYTDGAVLTGQIR